MRKLFGSFVIVLVFAGFVSCTDSEKTEYRKDETSSLLINEVRTIRELTSINHEYRNTVQYENKDSLVADLPVVPKFKISSAKKFKAVYRGRIKLGYNLKKVKIETRGNHIVVKYPKSKIVSHEINDIEVYEWSNGLWNKLDLSIFFKTTSEQKNLYEKKHFRDFDAEADANFKYTVKRHFSRVLRTYVGESSSNEVLRQGNGGYTIEFIREGNGLLSMF